MMCYIIGVARGYEDGFKRWAKESRWSNVFRKLPDTLNIVLKFQFNDSNDSNDSNCFIQFIKINFLAFSDSKCPPRKPSSSLFFFFLLSKSSLFLIQKKKKNAVRKFACSTVWFDFVRKFWF